MDGINAGASPEEEAWAAALPQLRGQGATASAAAAADSSSATAAAAAADSLGELAAGAGDWGEGQEFPELNELVAAVDDIVEEGSSSSSSDNVVTLTSQAVSVSSIDKTDHCCISFTTMQLRALLMQTDHMSASRKLQGWEQPPLPTVLVRWAIAGRHRSRGEADPPCLAG